MRRERKLSKFLLVGNRGGNPITNINILAPTFARYHLSIIVTNLIKDKEST